MNMRFTLRARGLAQAIVIDADGATDPRELFLKLAREAGLRPGQACSFTRQAPPELRVGYAGESGTAAQWLAAPEEELLDHIRAS